MRRTDRTSRGARHHRGIAVVEFAFVLPILLVLIFGVIELGRAVLTRQVLLNLSREAANLASRGTSLNDSIAAIQLSDEPLDMEANGFIIITEVIRDQNNKVKIRNQVSSGTVSSASRIGSGSGSAATLPSTPSPIPPQGLILYVAEVFYKSEPITPLGKLLNQSIGEISYDVAFF